MDSELLWPSAAGELRSAWNGRGARPHTCLNRAVLSSGGKPSSQALRQIRSQDFFLRDAQVVRHAIVSHDPRLGVEHGECRPPVAIAGLSNGAGVDEIAAIFS